MNVVCEVVEPLAIATSSCPATDIIMVRIEVANATSSVEFSAQPPTLISSGVAASSIPLLDSYSVLTNTANSTATVFTGIDTNVVLNSTANAQSRVYAVLTELAESVANATSGVPVAEAFQLLGSVANAMSSVPSAETIANVVISSTASAKSSIVQQGLSELAVSGANITSVIALIRREAAVDVTSTAEASSTVALSGTPETYLLVSNAEGTSLVQMQLDSTLVIESSADASSEIWYKDPTSKAWVMNTETTAVSWYDGFGFESIASWYGHEFAVGPDGIHELVGNTDNGEHINSTVKSGFDDYKDPHTKRVDNAYFGYTSSGTISVTVETYESGHAPYVYVLEQRSANAPRNSRITPGKGLWGRYWRMTVRNVDGADFEVHDASVDIATSTRRV